MAQILWIAVFFKFTYNHAHSYMYMYMYVTVCCIQALHQCYETKHVHVCDCISGAVTNNNERRQSTRSISESHIPVEYDGKSNCYGIMEVHAHVEFMHTQCCIQAL